MGVADGCADRQALIGNADAASNAAKKAGAAKILQVRCSTTCKPEEGRTGLQGMLGMYTLSTTGAKDTPSVDGRPHDLVMQMMQAMDQKEEELLGKLQSEMQGKMQQRMAAVMGDLDLDRLLHVSRTSTPPV